MIAGSGMECELLASTACSRRSFSSGRIPLGVRAHGDNYRVLAKVFPGSSQIVLTAQGLNFLSMCEVMKRAEAEKSIQSTHLGHGVVALVLECIPCQNTGLGLSLIHI